MKLPSTIVAPDTCSAAEFNSVVTGYLSAAKWADKKENTRARFPASQEKTARAICAAFIKACGPLFRLALSRPGYLFGEFGADLWLTRSGHGVGYWCRDALDVPTGEEFTCTDRSGKEYTLDPGTTIGNALSNVAYGDGSHISPFAYPSLYQYRGWLYFDLRYCGRVQPRESNVISTRGAAWGGVAPFRPEFETGNA